MFVPCPVTFSRDNMVDALMLFLLVLLGTTSTYLVEPGTRGIKLTLGKAADANKHQVITARTHNVAAQVTTLGRRLAMFGEELQDSLDDQKRMEKELMQAISESDESIIQNRSNADAVKRVTRELLDETAPIQD